jgi:hypothetical protein
MRHILTQIATPIVAQVRQNRTAAVVITLFAAMVFALSSLFAPQRSSVTATAVGAPRIVGNVVVEAERPVADPEEVLWLARCIYSETKQPHEQELVAWVVRNRVETTYRGNDTYREVVLDPWQFSAFNSNSPKRSHYTSLTPASTAAGFKTALSIAERVANAPASTRPFTQETRHFYSERSMVGGRAPNWASNKQPVPLKSKIDARRFRFYDSVS